MEHLKKLDGVAYVRFASVYRQFKNLNEFMNELRSCSVERGSTVGYNECVGRLTPRGNSS